METLIIESGKMQRGKEMGEKTLAGGKGLEVRKAQDLSKNISKIFVHELEMYYGATRALHGISMEIKERAVGRTFVVSMANGETQGYITTPEATGYEANLSMFKPESGARLVDKALSLVENLREQARMKLDISVS